MDLPSRVHPALAEAAVDDFLASEQWRDQSARYRWRVLRHDENTVIVTLPARPLGGTEEVYTLRLACDFYPTHPPDVRFVNPETLEYDPNKDRHHLPQLQAPYCAVHPTYGYSVLFPYGPQLVCSSMTLGYYFSGHQPTPDQRWVSGRDSIGTTIYAVHKALHSQYFNGRHPRQET